MLYLVLGITFRISTFFLIWSASMLKIFIGITEDVIDVLSLCLLPYILLSIP